MKVKQMPSKAERISSAISKKVNKDSKKDLDLDGLAKELSKRKMENNEE